MSPSSGTESVRRVEGTSCRTRWRKDLNLLTVSMLIVTFTCGQGSPIMTKSKESLTVTDISKAVEFMSKYGYLPPTDPNTGNLRTESQLREAIATMQSFGHIKPTGILDEATMKLMQRRRCGVADVMPGDQRRLRRYAIQGQKWTKTNLTWSVKSQDSTSDLRIVRPQLRRAFSVWSAASALNFAEVEGPRRADIVVSFLKGPHGDGYPFDGEGAVLAHAFFPGEGIGGDAHFDADEKWLSSRPLDEDEGVHLFAVAAHEIGHSLGLSHSSTPGSLMFPYYQAMGEYFTLPQDDTDGIRHLYGMKIPEKPMAPDVLPKTPILKTTGTTVLPSTEKIPLSTKKPRLTTESTKQSIIPDLAPPDVCNASIDAISVIRNEIFIFKGKHFWRLNSNRTLKSGYPAPIDRFWSALPQDIDKIDALYERSTDTKIIFFTGKFHWLFSGNKLVAGYPRPITDLGLPSDLEHVDAAMVWGHNGKTYFFSGNKYWKFDEEEGRVELDYPRNIMAWRGLPHDLDAAFQSTDGITYFFKGNSYWKFNDQKMQVQSKGFYAIGPHWFRCDAEVATTASTSESTILNNSKTSSAGTIHTSCIFMLTLFWVLFCNGLFHYHKVMQNVLLRS